MHVRLETARTDDGSAAAWVDRWSDGWATALVAAYAEGRPGAPVTHPQEELGSLTSGSDTYVTVVAAAVVTDEVGADVVVGAAKVMLSRRDNLGVALVEVGVLPDHRRRGVGTALLTWARGVATADGRTSLLADLDHPDGTGDDWPGVAFARSAGLSLRLAVVVREAPVPVPVDLAARLDVEVVAASSGYRLRSWCGPTDPADRDALARLAGRMTTDAPLGDLDYEPETWDAARVVDTEAEHLAQGYRWWTVVAETDAGEPVGFTQLGWSRWQPHRFWQWDTLVLREHRGRRLGLAMKLACLRVAGADTPAVDRVTTWNAGSNAPMIAVNEAMGFRRLEASQEWQGPVGGPGPVTAPGVAGRPDASSAAAPPATPPAAPRE